MLSKIKKLTKAPVELPILRARAMGMGFIESRIAQAVGSPAIAKTITRVFGIKDITKEEQKTARKKIKEEYGVDPELETMMGGRGGFGGGGSNKRINEIREMLIAVVESLTSITKKIDNITNQNREILKAAQSRLAEEVGKIMQEAAPPSAEPELPVGTEKSEGGIIVPKEKVVEKTVVEKAADQEIPAEPMKAEEPTKESEPTAIPKKEHTMVEKLVDRSVKFLQQKYPILKLFSSEKEKTGDESTTSKKPKVSRVDSVISKLRATLPDNPETLQPALEGIAEKKPVQSPIEPDELQEMLKEALKDALTQIKNENPELLGGNGGGIVSDLVDTAGSIATGGALLTAAGVGAAATAVTGGIAYAMDQSMKSGADKEIRKIIEKGTPNDIAMALKAGTPQQQAYKLQEFQKIAANNPELSQKLEAGKAISGMFSAKPGTTQSVPPRPDASGAQLSAPIPSSPGAEIVEMNRSLRAGEVSTQMSPQGTPIVQRITNNNVLPTTEKKSNIEVGNNENTFNRLIAQDFDHPATYSTFSMG